MNLVIEKLSEKHQSMIGAFSCVENKDMLSNYNSRQRRRIKIHSKEMDDFIKNEALEEQNRTLNTTHLLIDRDTESLVAYLSLCCDGIQLNPEERDGMNVVYQTMPAIKIARLAVSVNYRGHRFGKMLLDYAAYICEQINEQSGVAFITLDCYEHRLSYYQQYGFEKNQIQPVELPYDSPISMRVSLIKYLEAI